MLKSAKSFEFASLRKRHSYHLEQSTVTKNGTIPQSLGLIIQNNLKWGEQIFSTITKASKLPNFRQLPRHPNGCILFGFSVVEEFPLLTSSIHTMRLFVLFWNTAARCGICHAALFVGRTGKGESVRRLAMRIVFPGHSYDEALQLADCTRLSDRPNKTCIRS